MRRLGEVARALLMAVAAVALALTVGAALVHGAEPPRDALPYQRALTGTARQVWGLDAPVAVFGAQIHQESGWRRDARSKFAGGLAQFTPDTATWIGSLYRDELGAADPFNPSWAMRALVRYDKHLFDRVEAAATPCDRWAFTLSGYNGGSGWVARDRRLAELVGADPGRWWGNVELHSPRADWAMKENRGYPRRILLVLQPAYARWGPGVVCEVSP